jgi:hypothetical protein
MGTKFWELVSDEHGIGGSGEYCGDNAAHFERINVLYHASCLVLIETSYNYILTFPELRNKLLLDGVSECAADPLQRVTTVVKMASKENIFLRES